MRGTIVCLSLLPSLAFAVTPVEATGKNTLGETVVIEEGSAIYVKSKATSEPSATYPIAEVCPQLLEKFASIGATFSCIKRAGFPLTGVSYKVTTSKTYRPCAKTEPAGAADNSPGIVFVCVAGCNSRRAPKTFYVSPYECV